MLTTRCPLCDHDNHCAANSADCWCKQTSQQNNIPATLRALAGENRAHCICKACVNAFHADPVTFTAQYTKPAQQTDD